MLKFVAELETCVGAAGTNIYIQMVLCCLRSVYRQGCAPPPPAWDTKLLSTLIQHGYHPPSNQECVANILAHSCKVSNIGFLYVAGEFLFVRTTIQTNLLTVSAPQDVTNVIQTRSSLRVWVGIVHI